MRGIVIRKLEARVRISFFCVLSDMGCTDRNVCAVTKEAQAIMHEEHVELRCMAREAHVCRQQRHGCESSRGRDVGLGEAWGSNPMDAPM